MRAGTVKNRILAGPLATLAYLFAFVWLGIYVVGLANQVSTGGIGYGALGEMIPLIMGAPILFLSLTDRLNPIAFLAAVGAGVGLFADAALLQSPTVSGQLLSGLQNLSVQGATLAYQTSSQSIVATIGTFAVAEEGGFGMFTRTLLEAIFGISPGSPNYIALGIVVSAINGIFFDSWHLFVTAALYATLINAPPVFGVFNVALLLSPFSLSAIVARIILDTSIRVSKDYTSSIFGHAGYDMLVTGHALGLF